MSDDVVITRQVGRCLVVEINRPHVRNAISPEVARGLSQALTELERSAALQVGVITGVGANFSAGMDLGALQRGESSVLEEGGFAGIAERSVLKPLVAAVEGYALGGGFEIVLSCDLVVASDSAVFGLPEVRRGRVAAGGGLLKLGERIPLNRAMELALTGRRLTVAEAADLGLVNSVVESGGALTEALLLGERIAEVAPLAAAATKKIILGSRCKSVEEGFLWQKDIVRGVAASSDAAEGMAAFLEKREPAWVGE